MEEASESESPMEEDNVVSDGNTRTYLVTKLRELLNEALAREEIRDGACVQQLSMMILNTNHGQPLEPEVFRQLVERVINELQGRHQRATAHSRSTMAGVFGRYIAEFSSRFDLR